MKRLRITVDDQVYEVLVEGIDSSSETMTPPAQVESKAESTAAPAAVRAGGTTVPAPLSSMIVEIHVSVGETVTAGQMIVTVEAMKMNTIISAPIGGPVASIEVGKGDQVEEGQTILTID